MSLTPSNMLPLGTAAPDFSLIDTVSEEILNLNEIKGEKGTVIMFVCNHCPFVVHVNSEIVRSANEYQSKGISFVAISSNDVKNYPQDGPVLMKKVAEEEGYSFPYFDFYLFDENLKLNYRGQLDDSRPGNGIPLSGSDLRFAMDALIQGKENTQTQKPSIGCNIKWVTT